MSEKEYKQAITEVFRIEAILSKPARRKDVRLILRHMTLCSRIHQYETQRGSTPERAA